MGNIFESIFGMVWDALRIMYQLWFGSMIYLGCSWAFYMEHVEPLGWHPAAAFVAAVLGGLVYIAFGALTLSALGVVLLVVAAVYVIIPVYVHVSTIEKLFGDDEGWAFMLAPVALFGWMGVVAIGGWWSAIPFIAVGCFVMWGDWRRYREREEWQSSRAQEKHDLQEAMSNQDDIDLTEYLVPRVVTWTPGGLG